MRPSLNHIVKDKNIFKSLSTSLLSILNILNSKKIDHFVGFWGNTIRCQKDLVVKNKKFLFENYQLD